MRYWKGSKVTFFSQFCHLLARWSSSNQPPTQCYWCSVYAVGLKLSTSKTPLRSASGKWYLKLHFVPPAWILISFFSAVKKSWDETESIPFLSSYPTIMWFGHNAGVWERKGLNPLGLWSSCAGWQSLTTLAATLEESPPQVFTQHLCWLSSSCYELAETSLPVLQFLQGKSPVSSQKWLMKAGVWEGVWVFLHKTSWDEHPGQGPSALLGETDLWQGDGKRDLGTCETTPWTGSGNANQSHDIS